MVSGQRGHIAAQGTHEQRKVISAGLDEVLASSIGCDGEGR